MEINNLFDDDTAVSPVIGVILMVAITVILAAVIGTFVLGLGDNVQSTPTATFSFDYSNNGDEVTITHDGGETIPGDQLDTVVAGSDASSDWPTGSDISSGDSITISSGLNADDEIRVVWSSTNGDTTQTLASSEVPN
ncbi:type IV pilin [Halosegnis longus]|uniref:type IV pilin n=1 Tax=Halosegnis longus TaxID=2216012 RepID=UPI00129E68B6|nr:type IV pilin N-terminal domain-containing protein [Halosegnis longus]